MKLTLHRFKSLVFVALLLFFGLSSASSELSVPPLSGRVIDQTASLSAADVTALSQSLARFEAKTGTQFAVLIVATTAPESIEQTALRVVEGWQLGRKNIDDGAIVLIAIQDRAVRIEVGYGLEGALNDATAKRIIEEFMAPEFALGNYYSGLDQGLQQMMRVAEGEKLPPMAEASFGGTANLAHFVPIIFMLALVVGGILRAFLGRMPGAIVTGALVALVAWFIVGAMGIAIMAGAIALVITLTGSVGGLLARGGQVGTGLGGAWSSGSGGSMGSGGFSGGGGKFGGGGASGRW
jgi:uncharacterized protein